MMLPLGEVLHKGKIIDICGTGSPFLTDGEEQENTVTCKC